MQITSIKLLLYPFVSVKPHPLICVATYTHPILHGMSIYVPVAGGLLSV